MAMRRRSRAVENPIGDLLGKRLSTATIMFHAAVADRMGVSVTDATCRSILLQLGPVTAGDIAGDHDLTGAGYQHLVHAAALSGPGR